MFWNRQRSSPKSLLGGAALVAICWGLDARARSRDFGKLHRILVDLLLNALSAGDPVTERHSRRVADLADALFQTYRLSQRRHSMLRLAALLHDLGKIDDQFFPILHSPRPLTADERRKIEQHPHEGADILEPLEAIHPGISGTVEAHHECWNGHGYPKRLAGDAIPLGARIISVADVFDALTQPRAYRAPLSPEEAFAEIGKAAGTRFDPGVLHRLETKAVRDRWIEIAEDGRREEEEALAESHESEEPAHA